MNELIPPRQTQESMKSRSANASIVEYSLKDLNRPIEVSEHCITQNLPKQFRRSLPIIEEYEAELTQWEVGA